LGGIERAGRKKWRQGLVEDAGTMEVDVKLFGGCGKTTGHKRMLDNANSLFRENEKREGGVRKCRGGLHSGKNNQLWVGKCHQ